MADYLDVPVFSLEDLVMKYRPDVVKLNCEGCEHAVLEDIVRLPDMGVKTIIVQFHDRMSDNKRKMDAYNYVAKRLGRGRITVQSDLILTVIWEVK